MAKATPGAIRKVGAYLQAALEPLFILDSDFQFAFVNGAWEELTGFRHDAVIGTSCQAPWPEGGHAVSKLAASHSPPAEARLGVPCSTRSLIPRDHGEPHWCLLEFWPLHEKSKRLAAVLGWLRAIGDQPQAPESASARPRVQLDAIRQRLLAARGHATLLGQGAAHARLMDQVGLAIQSSHPFWIVAEPGSGIQTLVNVIQRQGRHPDAPILKLDPAALPAHLLNHELVGEVEQPWQSFPEGALVLVGEVVEVPRDVQAGLATALAASDSARVRIAAWSAHKPEAALAAGLIREDLYYQLTRLVLELQPLRDRLDDLPMLAMHFLEKHARAGERGPIAFDEPAWEVLRSYDWPGNLAELRRVVIAAAARSTSELIRVEDLPAAIQGEWGAAYASLEHMPRRVPLDATLEAVERRLIEESLVKSRYNKSKAAELLDISRPRLYRRMKELGIADLCESSGDGGPTSA